MNSKNINLFYIALLIVFPTKAYRAITYNLNRGRLGDHILTVIKCLYAAQEHDLEFLYQEFELSNKLGIHTLEKKYREKRHAHLPTKKIKNIEDIKPEEQSHHLIYVTDLKLEILPTFNYLHAYIFNNRDFRTRLNKVFQPTIPIATIDRPNDMISVAIHLRSGEGYDRPLLSKQLYSDHESLVTYNIWILQKTGNRILSQSYSSLMPNSTILRKPVQEFNYQSSSDWKETKYSFSDLEHPTRFPPLQFYIDQIKFLHNHLNKAPLFVHIFTDHPDPKVIVDKIKDNVNIENITYSYREQGNTHDANILDDLFAMMDFDCLIRPGSSYSKTAQLLGNHKIIIYPANTTWIEKKKLVVNEVGLIFKVH